MDYIHLKLETIAKHEFNVAMNYIQITKEYVVATDASVLVIIPTNEIFSEDIIEDFEHDVFYIAGVDWSKFRTMSNMEFVNDNLIQISYKSASKNQNFIKVKTAKDIKYPNWEPIIPTKDSREAVDEFALNIDKLSKLKDALPYTSFRFRNSGKNKALVITDYFNNYKAEAIIMPMVIEYEK